MISNTNIQVIYFLKYNQQNNRFALKRSSAYLELLDYEHTRHNHNFKLC